MRVLVCGGRNYADADTLCRTLDALHAEHGFDLVIHGGARGADAMASAWAAQRGVPVEQYEAEWRVYRKAAGAIRNRRMLAEGRPELVIAYPGGRGTADMVTAALRAGVRVLELR